MWSRNFMWSRNWWKWFHAGSGGNDVGEDLNSPDGLGYVNMGMTGKHFVSINKRM